MGIFLCYATMAFDPKGLRATILHCFKHACKPLPTAVAQLTIQPGYTSHHQQETTATTEKLSTLGVEIMTAVAGDFADAIVKIFVAVAAGEALGPDWGVGFYGVVVHSECEFASRACAAYEGYWDAVHAVAPMTASTPVSATPREVLQGILDADARHVKTKQLYACTTEYVTCPDI